MGSEMKQMTERPSRRRPTMPASARDWTWRETLAWVRPVVATSWEMFCSPDSRARRILRRLGSARVRNHEAMRTRASSETGGAGDFLVGGMVGEGEGFMRLRA